MKIDRTNRRRASAAISSAIEFLEDRRLFAVGPTLAGISLMNAATDTVVKPFTAGTVLDMSGGKTWTVRANTGADPVGSVVFKVDGVVVRTESFAPYSIAGEVGTDYTAWNVPSGNHTLTVTPFSDKSGAGTAGTTITAAFSTTGVPVAGVTGLTLVNAVTNADIKPLTNGTVIDLSGGKQYSVRATVAGSTTKSVVFKLDGTTVRTESSAPFSIAGDNPITGGTDFLPWTGLTNGAHTLIVGGFDATGGTGNAQQAQTVSFSVTGVPAPTFGVTTLTLVNAATNADIKPLTNGTVIDLSGGKQYSVRANIAGATKSVTFKLDGAVLRTESSSPFSIAGDTPITGGIDYAPWTGLTNGAHTLFVAGFDATGGTGNAGTAVTVNFSVTGVPAATFGVSGLTLVDAATDLDVGPITAGMTIDFTGGKQYSIRANVIGSGTTKSVSFKLDSAVVRTESSAPFSIAGDNPKTGGTDYLPWAVANGAHTLVVTGYNATGGTGTAGAAVTVGINVVGATAPTGAGIFKGVSINGATGSVVAGVAGAWTLKSNGTGISGSKDQFHFANQTRNGDFDVKVKLQSLVGGAAGLVVRSGTAAGNSEVAILFNAGKVSFGSPSDLWRQLHQQRKGKRHRR